jgi:hypothetical protein
MKETVSRAIDHMMLTFDETEVFVDAMRIIFCSFKNEYSRVSIYSDTSRKRFRAS